MKERRRLSHVAVQPHRVRQVASTMKPVAPKAALCATLHHSIPSFNHLQVFNLNPTGDETHFILNTVESRRHWTEVTLPFVWFSARPAKSRLCVRARVWVSNTWRFLIYVGFNVFFFLSSESPWANSPEGSTLQWPESQQSGLLQPPRAPHPAAPAASPPRRLLYSAYITPPRDPHFLYNLLSGRHPFFSRAVHPSSSFCLLFPRFVFIEPSHKTVFQHPLVSHFIPTLHQFSYSVCREPRFTRVSERKGGSGGQAAECKRAELLRRWSLRGGPREEEVTTTVFFIQVNPG